MIYPVNEFIHQNLNTTFTNFTELVTDLKETRFTGYIMVNYWQFEALILMDSGQITQAFYQAPSGKDAGLDAYEVILDKAQEKDGTVNVAKIDSDLIYLLSGIPYSSKNERAFILNDESLIKVQDLLKENSYSAVISAMSSDKVYSVYLFFYEGNLISLSGKKGDSLEITGIGNLEKLLKLIKKQEFNAEIRHVDLQRTVEVLKDFSLQEKIEEWVKYYGALYQNLLKLLAADKKKYDGFAKMLLETRAGLADKYNFLDPFMENITLKDGEFSLNSYVNFYQFVNGMDHLFIDVTEKVLEGGWKKVKEEDIAAMFAETYEQFEDINKLISEDKRELLSKVR